MNKKNMNKQLNSFGSNKFHKYLLLDTKKNIYRSLFIFELKNLQIQNQQMRQRLKKIDEELEMLNKFNSHIDIIQNLETTLQFLKLQNSTNKLIHFMDNLIKEKKEPEQKISESYNSLKKSKDVQQSILMHEGNPDAGYYFKNGIHKEIYHQQFNYIQLYCFNDANVNEISEQNVLNYAYGDIKKSKSAYLLQYVKEEKVKQGQNFMMKLKQFSKSEDNNYLNDGYGLLLSQIQSDFYIKIIQSQSKELNNSNQLDIQNQLFLNIKHF
ncbi:unnamed protein product [Paramecium sonneborni]|uniref:Uncharacterized protein n=1 Tax=Paramecium sonneborni TaxID=65129 RepID=A0A8S1RMM8_9CILI|nr:unnamed protein product [Paramecium sonneborni]